LKQFIAINDKVEMDAMVFMSNGRCGVKSKTAERQKERVCERRIASEINVDC
jgi:hypothetical protein